MPLPLISEYIQAIKSAEENFDELKNLRPMLGEDGEPIFSNGNFAIVFKMKDGQTGKLYAVKCFTKEQKERAKRYQLIANELEFVSSNYLTQFKYLEKELFVETQNSDENEFPVLLMDWVEGVTLDIFIRKNINNQYALEMLAYQFCKLSYWLLTQPFAHGDLKPDNIIIKDDGTLVLVDYDGMFVPAMKGQKARELGSPDYRHPSRTEDSFDEHIDDFSIATISLSLKAIALNPTLWSEFGANDRLLFCSQDFQNLSESKLISSLQILMQNSEFCTLYGIFLIAYAQKELTSISYRLLAIEKTQKEDLQKVISLYLKAKEYVEKHEYEKAFYIFSSLAKRKEANGEEVEGVGLVSGKALGENGLGYMYAYGLFVKQDYQQSFHYYKMASEKGFAMSEFNLGICYKRGFGVKRNSKMANDLFHTTALKRFGYAIELESWSITGLSMKEEAAINMKRYEELTSKFVL